MSSLNVKKHDLACVYYSSLSPVLSRYFSEKCFDAREETNVEQCPNHVSCQYCHALFTPDNHVVRFKPAAKIRKRVKKLMKKNSGLGRMQKHLIKNAKNRQVVPTIACKVCKKRYKLDGFKPKKKTGQKRDRNPNSDHTKINKKEKMSNCKKVQSLPKQVVVKKPKDLPTLLKRGKTTKEAHTRLQGILKRNKQNDSKGGGLQSFLSSL